MPSILRRNSKISSQRHLIPDSLSHSAGTITAVIGDRSFTGSIAGAGGHTLYHIYLLPSGMSISGSSSSVYRASNPSAIYIGALYTLSTGAFGSFVNIEGEPRTVNQLTTMVNMTANGAQNPSSPSEYIFQRWERHGGFMHYTWKSHGGFTASGSGAAYLFPIPSGFSLDGNRTDISNSDFFHRSGPVGHGHYINNANSNSRTLTIAGYSTSQLYAAASMHEGTNNLRLFGPNTIPVNTSFNDIGFKAELPIAGWTTTPLKDQ